MVEKILASEAEELFVELDRRLEQLDQNPVDREIANRIYQLFHSIKTLCSVSGLAHLGGLAMMVSSHFDIMRQGKTDYTAAVRQLSLATAEYLHTSIRSTPTATVTDLGKLDDFYVAWRQIGQTMGKVDLVAVGEERRGREMTRQWTVLIIDDEFVNRTLLEEAVMTFRPDMTIITVDNVEEGLFHFFTKEIDIVFLDIMMPNMDGNDFIAVVQKNFDSGNLQRLPGIIVQTAIQSMQDLLGFVRKECVQEVIRKPIALSRVRDCLDLFCPLHG